jgi:two-component system, chemotaxis family, chemotaxis protein CheY
MAELPRVLIVDDDALIRRMLHEALSDVPCTVGEASGGREALRLVATQAPDIVILDLLLPDISGLELLKHVKENCPLARVFVISALDSEPLAQQAAADGAHGFLSKPFHPLDVQNLVRSALEKPRTKGQP